MALNKQVHIFSIDTSAFYNISENKLHDRLNFMYCYRNKLKLKQEQMERKQKKYPKCSHNKFKKNLSIISKEIKNTKDKLYEEFKKNKNIRTLNKNYLYTSRNKVITNNLISVFESTLTRTLKIPENDISLDFMVVQTFFFDVLEDIILDGFLYNDEKYICLTASAGQIRTKKTVFIKEKVFLEYRNSLMCGLTVERINELGGVNINKYLAYLALFNSATDQWGDFDIIKCIVVDDMETLVNGEVDFINDKTYEIERKKMDVPITHTDGCGMVLPQISEKSFMVRLPWVKGLLIPFAFDNFIKDNEKANSTITDIYGNAHDVIKENIQIIFTKSQFKMWKYYKDWNEYQNNFINYNCQAGKCNIEEDDFNNAKINYQMLQTLTDMTDKELLKIANQTIYNIKNIGNDKRVMLKVLGVTKSNTNKNHYQQALEIYPQLLTDTYSKEVLKQVKKSLVVKGKAGKLDVNSVYSFICPDLYAFCEWLFLGDKNPKGLLNNYEVYCDIYKNYDKIDCLRSPHLYCEHAIRNNVVDDEKGKWFITDGLYTSIHDMISKILMFDVDGDKSLIISNKTLIDVAERNMKDIVPLYYNMAKAGAVKVTNENIYKGLISAYTGGNIGEISNNISKIWNSDNVNLEAIKLLCMENNFTIDYAKTLYKPTRPKDKKQLINSYTKFKIPHFFVYAKNKKEKNVECVNNSLVNRLEKIIPNPNINFKSIGLNDFNYKMLLSHFEKDININTETAKKIISKYTELDLKKHFMLRVGDEKEKTSKIKNQYHQIKEQILNVCNDVKYVSDVLVEYLYIHKQSSYKTTLWECFGDILVENLKRNVKEVTIYCERCGDVIVKKSNRQKLCDECWKEKEKEIRKDINRKYYLKNKIKTV